MFIVGLLEDQMRYQSQRNIPISPLHQVLVVFRYFPTESFYLTLADTLLVFKSDSEKVWWHGNFDKISAEVRNVKWNPSLHLYMLLVAPSLHLYMLVVAPRPTLRDKLLIKPSIYSATSAHDSGLISMTL